MLASSRLPLLVTSLGALWLVASGVTCAAGNQGPVTGGAATTGSSSSGTALTSSSGSTGGTGGVTTTSSITTSSSTSSGTGGTGGGTSSSSSGSCASSASSSGAPTPGSSIVGVEEYGNAVVGYSDNLVSMSGFSNPWSDFSSDPVGLAFTGNGAGIAVLRSQYTPDGGTPVGELRFARWTGGAWSPGFGQSLLPVQPSPSLYINGGPSVAGSSLRAHSAFQGTDMKFYYAEYFNGSWFPTDEPIMVGAAQSLGPVPPAIATFADVPTIAFVGNDGNVYDQTRMCGAWQGPNGHGVTTAASITPAIIALYKGAELLIVYTDSAADGLMFTIRTAGTWSAPAAIAGASSADQVSLAPLAAGGAVLSYRGTDMHLYTTILSASSPFTWTTPVTGVMGLDPVLVTSPAVATGATGADAELLFLESPSYILYSARMTAGAWGAASMTGSATYHLALATGG